MSIPRDDFSQFEFDGWQRVADRYETAWSGLTRLFVPPLLQAVDVAAGDRMLDVACGPGYVAEAAHALGAHTIGVDFSPEMVRLAQARSPGLRFVVGDAQSLEFADDGFDVVVMNFGVLHLARPDAAFAEARRVLRTGGRYGFTVWASPEHSPGAAIVEDAVRAHTVTSVALPQGPDYFGYGDAEGCRRALDAAGFDTGSMTFRTVVLDWPVPSAEFVFEAERDAGVRTAALLAAQEPAVLAAIRAQMETEFRPYASVGGFRVPYAAHVVAARVG